MRDFEPFREQILVRIKDSDLFQKYKKNERGKYEEVTESGFIIPKAVGIDQETGAKQIKAELSEDEIAREYMYIKEGYVVKVGPTAFHDQPGSEVSPGDLVAFGLHSGDKVQIDDEDGHQYVVLMDSDLRGKFPGESLKND